MLQKIDLEVAYVIIAIHVCCKCMFQNVSVVSNIYCKCFYLDVVYVALAIHVCCKCMFQIFQLFSNVRCKCVLSGCCICCTGYTRMLQVYVSNVSAVSKVCCNI
jgi:hypothetical protein